MTMSLNEIKKQKYQYAFFSFESESSYFKYDGLVFEGSAYVEARLLYVSQLFTQDPNLVIQWFAKEGSYEFGERDFVYLTAESFQSFKSEYERKMRSLLTWKKSIEYWLSEAETLDDILAIGTLYTGE